MQLPVYIPLIDQLTHLDLTWIWISEAVSLCRWSRAWPLAAKEPRDKQACLSSGSFVVLERIMHVYLNSSGYPEAKGHRNKRRSYHPMAMQRPDGADARRRLVASRNPDSGRNTPEKALLQLGSHIALPSPSQDLLVPSPWLRFALFAAVSLCAL